MPKTVFHVDADPVCRGSVTFQLRRIGMRVNSFESSEDLLVAMVRENELPHVVIIDVENIAILHAIGSNPAWSEITVIVFIEDEDPQERENILKRNALIVKKSDFEDLLLCIAQLQ